MRFVIFSHEARIVELCHMDTDFIEEKEEDQFSVSTVLNNEVFSNELLGETLTTPTMKDLQGFVVVFLEIYLVKHHPPLPVIF